MHYFSYFFYKKLTVKTISFLNKEVQTKIYALWALSDGCQFIRNNNKKPERL